MVHLGSSCHLVLCPLFNLSLSLSLSFLAFCCLFHPHSLPLFGFGLPAQLSAVS